MSILGIIVASLFVAMFARLVFLQVFDSSRLAAAAQANQVRTVYEEAPRGRILDRNGEVLAGNRGAEVITVDREAPKKDSQLLSRLGDFLGIDANVLKQRVNDGNQSQYKPAVVVDNVSPGVIAAFRERQEEFPGVSAETQVQRWYPSGTLAAHMLGYVGEINDKELSANKDNGYRLGNNIGKSGIEASYESELRGIPGVSKVEVDAMGRAVRVLESTPPVPGHDLQLTVDKKTQVAAENALFESLQLAQGVTNPAAEETKTEENKEENKTEKPVHGGSAVAIDPQNGGVLAMASFPTFDPTSFARGISQGDYNKLTSPESGLPLNNRVIQGQYAPGSTFKLVTSIAGLKSGVINANTVINDTGAFYLGNQRFQNAQGKSYGPVAISKSLSVSSDVFYYTLGSRLWEARKRVGDPIQQVARDLGMDAKSGIAINGETPGRIPDPENRKKMHQQNPTAFPESNWYAGDNVNLSIGQGDTLATPLQLANAYATFGNGGTLYRPKLVSKIIDTKGKVIDQPQSQVIKKVDISQAVRQPIEQGLADAVRDSKGTAYGAFAGFDLGAFQVAGKTGTAQVTGKQDTALFAAYGPVGKPRAAVAVVLEESGWGGTAAAPVARQVFAAISGQEIKPLQLGTGTD